jgi:hypothetical protein
MALNTAFLLMAQYNGKAIVPLAEVCRDYFSHLTPEKLVRKVLAGQIALPIVHIERSQKSATPVTGERTYVLECRTGTVGIAKTSSSASPRELELICRPTGYAPRDS